MKIITLAENSACSAEFASEHGLSLWVEAAGKKFLFDAGQTELFAENASKLGVELGKADFAVLSHGHYDHGGGMARFRKENPHAPIYVNRMAFGPHYHGPEKYIGLPRNFPEAELTGEQFWIAPGLTLATCAEKGWAFDCRGLTVREGGRHIPDPFDHEQYLLVEEEGRRILLSGCSHKGIRNLLEHYRPDVFVGGMHLGGMDPEGAEFLELVQDLVHWGTVFYTGHCTGARQHQVLQRHLGGRIHRLCAGAVYELTAEKEP